MYPKSLTQRHSLPKEGIQRAENNWIVTESENGTVMNENILSFQWI